MSRPAEDLQLDPHRLWDAIAVIELAVDWLDGVALEEPHYVDGERVVMRPMMRSDIAARLNLIADLLASDLYQGRETP
jgi:hypothetical protein